ncbi:MAG: ParB N-terminal domain-containing protein [Ruminococcus sp.]|nr:ParB N-terminal domain-containing protein [Ruminococcus sp.]MCM1479977.1 ParB N-terminal domain-containing protein [Muribaculaceae bacterium]
METSDVREISIDSLVSFRPSMPVYTGERLKMLMNSISEAGLQYPIIVRPIEDEKYQIIAGHNRVEAFKALGKKTIPAQIKTDITDEKAEQIFIETNTNQQNFNDWKYSLRIETVKYYNKRIESISQQGRRTDLKEKSNVKADDTTSVYVRQKSKTSRDRMAHRLGISTATFSKYRRIIKLPDDVLNLLAQMLDEGVISFGAAYRISKFKAENVKIVLNYFNKNRDVKFKIEPIEELCKNYNNFVLTEQLVKHALPDEEANKLNLTFAPIPRSDTKN